MEVAYCCDTTMHMLPHIHMHALFSDCPSQPGTLNTEQEHRMSPRYIWIVDSDPSAALVTQLGLQARLQSEDIEVTIATAHNLDREYTINNMVDLLIVDPGFQSQAAINLVRTLKTDCPQTPLVVLTAYDSPLLRAQMRSLDVEGYLAKPIDLLELEHVVRRVLETSTPNHAVPHGAA
jgi:DNA-binding response OmpR family regulator